MDSGSKKRVPTLLPTSESPANLFQNQFYM